MSNALSTINEILLLLVLLHINYSNNDTNKGIAKPLDNNNNHSLLTNLLNNNNENTVNFVTTLCEKELLNIAQYGEGNNFVAYYSSNIKHPIIIFIGKIIFTSVWAHFQHENSLSNHTHDNKEIAVSKNTIFNQHESCIKNR
jgi:hypothetical protein